MENFVENHITKKLVLLSGVVSNTQTITSTSGDINKGKGSINTSHQTSFRVDGTPVSYSGIFNIAEGDNVLLIGKEHNGQVVALSIKNNTTGVVAHGSITALIIIATVITLIGLYASLVIIASNGSWLVLFGIIFILPGLFLYWTALKNKMAKKLLNKELSII